MGDRSFYARAERGVYFFFEPSECRNDGIHHRVVRVGTHAVSSGSKATLWSRLRTHRGHLEGSYPGGGNHRGTVFRKLVGKAIIEKSNLSRDYPNWGIKDSTDSELKKKEHPLELKVSQVIREMYFTWIEIDDARAILDNTNYEMLVHDLTTERFQL